MTSSPSWITVSPSRPSEGIIERRAARPPGARPERPGITPGEYSNGASGENHSGTHKLRQGSYFPPFLEPRKTAEKALVTVIQEAWIGGGTNPPGGELGEGVGPRGS